MHTKSGKLYQTRDHLWQSKESNRGSIPLWPPICGLSQTKRGACQRFYLSKSWALHVCKVLNTSHVRDILSLTRYMSKKHSLAGNQHAPYIECTRGNSPFHENSISRDWKYSFFIILEEDKFVATTDGMRKRMMQGKISANEKSESL